MTLSYREISQRNKEITLLIRNKLSDAAGWLAIAEGHTRCHTAVEVPAINRGAFYSVEDAMEHAANRIEEIHELQCQLVYTDEVVRSKKGPMELKDNCPTYASRVRPMMALLSEPPHTP